MKETLISLIVGVGLMVLSWISGYNWGKDKEWSPPPFDPEAEIRALREDTNKGFVLYTELAREMGYALGYDSTVVTYGNNRKWVKIK